jgi:hypothetical protein
VVHAVAAAGAPFASMQVTTRDCVPPPQLVLHTLQAPDIQLVEVHAAELQLWLEGGGVVVHAVLGNTAPVASAHTTARVWVPPPQLTVHAPNMLVTHVPLAHACTLQL